MSSPKIPVIAQNDARNVPLCATLLQSAICHARIRKSWFSLMSRASVMNFGAFFPPPFTPGIKYLYNILVYTHYSEYPCTDPFYWKT